MFVLRVSNNNVNNSFFLFFFFFFFFGFVEDLWFDDVICGFWVDDWVFYRIC